MLNILAFKIMQEFEKPLTFNTMNFLSGSYHSIRKTSFGVAPQR
jgi:hypothetical protein